MVSSGAWIAMAALVVIAALVLWIGPCVGLDPAVSGSIVGALIGGAGVLLGITLDRAARHADERTADAEKRRRLKTLIAAELVNLAAGMLDAHRIITSDIEAIAAGAVPGAFEAERYMPREMAIVSGMGAELLVLSEREIDVLSTLMSNLQITRGSIADRAAIGGALTLMDASLLKSEFAHDLGLVAEAFEEFAPTRKFRMPGAAAEELATVLLRREASREARG